jgi:dUTPase
VEVVAKLPESPVKELAKPLLHKVATKLVVDEALFLPQYSTGCSYVSIRANLSNRGAIRLPHRGIETVDCGFELELPEGYRAILSQNRLLAAKGLFLTGPRIIDGKQRVQVTIINCGHQIIEVHNGDLIAEMSVEPVYVFDFQEL